MRCEIEKKQVEINFNEENSKTSLLGFRKTKNKPANYISQNLMMLLDLKILIFTI